MNHLSLHADLKKVPKQILPSNKDEAEKHNAEFLHLLKENGASVLAKELSENKGFLDFVSIVFTHSEFFRNTSFASQTQFSEIVNLGFKASVENAIENAAVCWRECTDEKSIMRFLREKKSIVALSLGLADLGGWLSAEEVTNYLSRFAEVAVQSAVNFLLLDLHNREKVTLVDLKNPSFNSGLIILGMGKLGASELNYSSDIDLICFFDENNQMQINDDDTVTLFVRFVRSLIKIIGERTEDGYVFRTDFRLRPDPSSTQLALPIETAFTYYESRGQNWERVAFIRARAIAGDIEAGSAFLKELEPFVWRRHLDFAAISDIHSIKRQIHSHKGHEEIAIFGHNVKLGRGGIREIEFFAQTQQLIAGGKDRELRKIGTGDALDALAGKGWIETGDSEALIDAYWHLRRIEHCIQMKLDSQSHNLPNDQEGLLSIALMMGYKDCEQFKADYLKTAHLVEQHYGALFESAPQLTGQGSNLVFTGDDEDPGTVETLSQMGFAQPTQIIDTIKSWHFGHLPAVQTPQSRELLTELVPAIIEAIVETDAPDQNFFLFERFLKGLPAALQLFSILKTNPNLLRLLANLLGSSPRLAAIITSRPSVFDAFIAPSFDPFSMQAEALEDDLNFLLNNAKDYEAKLDVLRIFNEEQKFLISLKLMNQTISTQKAGAYFSLLAEIILSFCLDIVVAEFEVKHGKIDGGEIAIVAMGRLGSEELTAGSDLDLIFLYRHGEQVEMSDGEKSLPSTTYYIRLVQRLIAAISAPTSEGHAYELDFRLRPSGNSGPLATDFSGFVTYQNEKAKTWEHQALVRARPICGDVDLMHDVEKEIEKALQQKRDPKAISKDILEMRELIDAEKPAKHIFDLKTIAGGVIDIEFIAQWGVLLSGKLDLKSRSTPDLIQQLPNTLIETEDKQELLGAFELYNLIFQLLRVNLNDQLPPEEFPTGFKEALCDHAGEPDIEVLSARLEEVTSSVRRVFNKLMRG